jgi:hypothetical protein
MPFTEGGQYVLDEDEEQEESASASLVRPYCLKEEMEMAVMRRLLP